jgi:hypothetical protein
MYEQKLIKYQIVKNHIHFGTRYAIYNERGIMIRYLIIPITFLFSTALCHGQNGYVPAGEKEWTRQTERLRDLEEERQALRDRAESAGVPRWVWKE